MPTNVTRIDMIKLVRMAWASRRDAFFSSPFPRALEINAVMPIDNPAEKPMIMKYIGNDLAIAVIALGDIKPANLTSTML